MPRHQYHLNLRIFLSSILVAFGAIPSFAATTTAPTTVTTTSAECVPPPSSFAKGTVYNFGQIQGNFSTPVATQELTFNTACAWKDMLTVPLNASSLFDSTKGLQPKGTLDLRLKTISNGAEVFRVQTPPGQAYWSRVAYLNVGNRRIVFMATNGAQYTGPYHGKNGVVLENVVVDIAYVDNHYYNSTAKDEVYVTLVRQDIGEFLYYSGNSSRLTIGGVNSSATITFNPTASAVGAQALTGGSAIIRVPGLANQY